jgi:hypothetical protein
MTQILPLSSSSSPACSPSLSLAVATAPSRNLRASVGSGCRRTARRGVGVARVGRRSAARARSGRDSLGGYRDTTGRSREVIARRRSDGSLLVMDRDAQTRGDGRLVAHIEADEPVANAALVCALYLRDAHRGRCRRVTVEDVIGKTLPGEGEESPQLVREADVPLRHGITEGDVLYRLELVRTDFAARELRWCRRSCRDSFAAAPIPMCLREVIGAIESYEPAFGLTRKALAGYRRDANVSTTVLRCELERLSDSPIVLNRELRRAVLAAVENGGLSLSEIAIRCGRVKRDPKGNTSGETSWLARRVGILPESGSGRRTPWIHSDVLALIARNGLSISPREVELG